MNSHYQLHNISSSYSTHLHRIPATRNSAQEQLVQSIRDAHAQEIQGWKDRLQRELQAQDEVQPPCHQSVLLCNFIPSFVVTFFNAFLVIGCSAATFSHNAGTQAVADGLFATAGGMLFNGFLVSILELGFLWYTCRR